MASKTHPGQSRGIKYLLTVALVFLFLGGTFYVPTARGGARARFLHLAPGAGQLEIWIDGSLVTGDLVFTQKTDYLELASEKHRVICKTKNANNLVVLNSLFPFRDDKDYTIAITGRGDGRDLQLHYRIDSCPPSKNLAQVNFTNSVFGAPPVDLEIRYGPTLYRGMAFRTSGSCQLIPPGNYRLRLLNAKTGKLIHEESIDFAAGTRYNLFSIKTAPEGEVRFLYFSRTNTPEETPKIFGVERSVLQLFGAGLIASLVILVIGR